jgi:hypothetical protein
VHAFEGAGATSHKKMAIGNRKHVRWSIADIVHCAARRNRGLKTKKKHCRLKDATVLQPGLRGFSIFRDLARLEKGPPIYLKLASEE